MPNTYLSVDVDYWVPFDYREGSKEMERFFNKIIQLDVPILIVKDHEELLEDINKRICPTLINVDYHSDITSYIDDEEGEVINVYEWHDETIPADLNCGTWVNFVDERVLGTFKWLYPRGQCIEGIQEGRCEDIDGFWEDEWGEEFHNWHRILAKKGWQKNIKWIDVQAVGIALSHDWLYDMLEDHFFVEVYPRLLHAGAKPTKPFLDRYQHVMSLIDVA